MPRNDWKITEPREPSLHFKHQDKFDKYLFNSTKKKRQLFVRDCDSAFVIIPTTDKSSSITEKKNQKG